MAQTEQSREVDRNYDFFMRHLNEYLANHRDEYALIRNRELIGFSAQGPKQTERYFFRIGLFPDLVDESGPRLPFGIWPRRFV